MDISSGAVDIGNLEMSSFLQPESTEIDGCQTDTMMEQANRAEYLTNLVSTQNDREFLLLFHSDKGEGGPRALKSIFVEELNAA